MSWGSVSRNPLLLSIAAISLGGCASTAPRAPAKPSAPEAHGQAEAPHLRRGNEVEKRYRDYTARFQGAYERLMPLLEREAPALHAKLKGAPPKPVEYGYQIVPRLVPDPKPEPGAKPKQAPRATSTAYSWTRTDTFLDWEIPKIASLEERLDSLAKLSPAERLQVFERIASDYPAMESNQRVIDSHLQYNRFWQAAIHNDLERFKRLTQLHDLVLERQWIKDALGIEGEAPFRRAYKEIRGTKPADADARPRAELEATLRRLEAEHARLIHAYAEHVQPAPYVKARKIGARSWALDVKVYTDIADERFLGAFKRAIERIWRARAGDATYQIRLRLARLAPRALYKGAPPPARGTHLDIGKHVELFPSDGGVITTGANSTFAIPSRYVALGPQEISHNVIAHEFGHLLGFIDGYFRGFRDRAEQGYEVLEIVPDTEDLMCAPGGGRVFGHHFENVIRLVSARPRARPRRRARAPRPSGPRLVIPRR